MTAALNALLAAAALGQVDVAALDAALLQAQLLRRMAEAVVKGRRRLRAGHPDAAPEGVAGYFSSASGRP